MHDQKLQKINKNSVNISVGRSPPRPPLKVKKNSILITCLIDGLGGIEVHVIQLCKKLQAAGYSYHVLTYSNSPFCKRLEQEKLPYSTTKAWRFRDNFLRPIFHMILRRDIKKVCTEHNISLIYCNTQLEPKDCVALKKKLPIKVVCSRHVHGLGKCNQLANVDAVITVSSQIAKMIDAYNQEKKLNIPIIECISPLFDIKKFARNGRLLPSNRLETSLHQGKRFFTTLQTPIPFASLDSHTLTRDSRPPQTPLAPMERALRASRGVRVLGPRYDYFKETFGINLRPGPLVTMIANFYSDSANKNHDILLNAIHKLAHTKNKVVQAVLVGDGPKREQMQALAHKLGLADTVFFVGYTPKTAEILYYADAMVLTSKEESFGIVYLEAGMMQKPAIGADQTGAVDIIIDGKTGLLFKNGDVDDFARQLERIVDDPAFAQQMGLNAYQHVTKNFDPDVVFPRYVDLFRRM